MVVPQKHLKMIIFSRKTHGNCWVITTIEGKKPCIYIYMRPWTGLTQFTYQKLPPKKLNERMMTSLENGLHAIIFMSRCDVFPIEKWMKFSNEIRLVFHGRAVQLQSSISTPGDLAVMSQLDPQMWKVGHLFNLWVWVTEVSLTIPFFWAQTSQNHRQGGHLSVTNGVAI